MNVHLCDKGTGMREVVKCLHFAQREFVEYTLVQFSTRLESIGPLSRYGDQSANYRHQNIKVISSSKGQKGSPSSVI